MAKILHRGHILGADGLMRGEGVSEILQTEGNLKEQLLRIEKVGRICYRSERREITPESSNKFIRMIMRRGHESVIEHSSLSVIFSNISRGFTHECVRHRLCAFSQESTRYCDYSGGTLDLERAELVFILPPHKEMNEITEPLMVDRVEHIEDVYYTLRTIGDGKAWNPEDARQFLPIGIASKIAITANFREWRHIMAMRTQSAAHWEIRYVLYDLLTRLKGIIPVIFEDFTNLDEDGSLLRDENNYGYYRKAVAY